jgi:integrase
MQAARLAAEPTSFASGQSDGLRRISDEITAKVTMLKERTGIGRELSDDEVRRLLSACKSSVSRGLYPAVLISIHTGLRSKELRRLRWYQVDLAEGIIVVGKAKTAGGEGRLAYLSMVTVQVLKNWRAQFPECQAQRCYVSK